MGKQWMTLFFWAPESLQMVTAAMKLKDALLLGRKVKWKSLSRVQLCNSMDCTVHGILQARILEWVAFHFSRASSQPRDWTQVSCISGGFFTNWATKEAQVLLFFNFLNFLILFFYFTILYWFCHTLTWIHHRCTWVPNPEPPSHHPPHIISLGHPSAPAPSMLYPASDIDWQFVSYMIVYMFQCHSPKSSHPLPLPQSPKVCSLHLCLFCWGYHYHLSKFHIYVLVYCIGVFLSGLLHSV